MSHHADGPSGSPSSATAPRDRARDPDGIRIEALSGARFSAALDALSSLRVAVFREWPYLYDGHPSYEADYLATFAASKNALIVAAYDGERMIGAATAAPLAGHTDEFLPLFSAHGYAAEDVFYLGESVLLPAYRGRGIGHAFFDHRLAHASALAEERRHSGRAPFRIATFCGVVRADDDPRKPAQYRPLDAFWRKRGFEKADGLVGNYDWRELGADAESPHAMQFWIKPL